MNVRSIISHNLTQTLWSSAFTARVKLRLRRSAGSAYAFGVGADEEEEESDNRQVHHSAAHVYPFALLISEFETVQSIFSASLSALNEISRRNRRRRIAACSDCVVFCPRRRYAFELFEWRAATIHQGQNHACQCGVRLVAKPI